MRALGLYDFFQAVVISAAFAIQTCLLPGKPIGRSAVRLWLPLAIAEGNKAFREENAESIMSILWQDTHSIASGKPHGLILIQEITNASEQFSKAVVFPGINNRIENGQIDVKYILA